MHLEACRSIPDLAAEFIVVGRDPMAFQFEITTCDDTHLMDVPFRELNRPPSRRQDAEHQVRWHTMTTKGNPTKMVSVKCWGAHGWQQFDA